MVKSEKITQGKMMEVLDWTYDKVLNGVPGTKTVDELAADYLRKYDEDTAIKHLITNQMTKATTSGFITGFGGILTIPVTLPANITSVLFVQMRMVAVIAKIRGFELKSDQVQTFVYATLVGSSVADIIKKSGIEVGNKIGTSLVKRIPFKILKKINKDIGFRFITKAGTTGTINLVKLVPVLGAGISGAFDNLTTRQIANMAKKTFLEEGLNVGDGTVIDKNMANTITAFD